MAETLNTLVGVGAAALQVFFAVMLVLALTARQYFDAINRVLSTRALMLGTLLGIVVIGMSLYYQYVVGFPVCPLCWWQRIALYPLAFLFAIAWWRNDRRIVPYVLSLVIFGAVFALYHEWLQIGGASLIPCAADGSVDCAKVYLNIFDYITFPVLALTSLAGFAYLAYLLRANEV